MKKLDPAISWHPVQALFHYFVEAYHGIQHTLATHEHRIALALRGVRRHAF